MSPPPPLAFANALLELFLLPSPLLFLFLSFMPTLFCSCRRSDPLSQSLSLSLSLSLPLSLRRQHEVDKRFGSLSCSLCCGIVSVGRTTRKARGEASVSSVFPLFSRRFFFFPLCSSSVQSQIFTWCLKWSHRPGFQAGLIRRRHRVTSVWGDALKLSFIPIMRSGGIMCYYTSEKTNIFYTSNNVITCMREQRRVSSETNTRDQAR